MTMRRFNVCSVTSCALAATIIAGCPTAVEENPANTRADAVIEQAAIDSANTAASESETVGVTDSDATDSGATIGSPTVPPATPAVPTTPGTSTDGAGSGPTPGPVVTPPPVVPPPPVVMGTPFGPSSASIAARVGGPRNDPEGVAPRAESTTLLTWRDSRGRERTMTLGAYLYQYDFTFSDGQAEVARSANDDAWGHEGFGYVVSHNTQNGNSPLGKVNPATKIETQVFAGGHHAIYRVEMIYDRDQEPGGGGIKIPVVIEWMVATGRDHPVWSVNWRTGLASNAGNVNLDVYRMDSRGPYGSLNFDGAATRGAGDAIGTIAWGDFARRFGTIDDMLSMQSAWVYDLPNRVPFVHATTASVNAEMGIVRTIAGDKQMGMPDRVVGRERGATSALAYTNRRDCNGYGDNRVYSMPCINGWPYQMMNYDWDPGTGKPLGEATGTKLLAWGTPYGYVGASSFDLFDYSAEVDGRGDRSYATMIVLGPKGRYGADGGFNQPGDVAEALRQVEALSDSTITNVTRGSLVNTLPVGPLSQQMRTVQYGYDDTYAVHHIRADGGAVFTFNPGGSGVRAPIFVVENYVARTVPKVWLGDVELTTNGDSASGAFLSLDEAGNRLWITLNRMIASPAIIRVEP